MDIKKGWTYNAHTLSLTEIETDGYCFWGVGRRWSAEKGNPPIFPNREEALEAMKIAAKELAASEYQNRLRRIESVK